MTTILIPVSDQAALLRRTLWALATRKPTGPFDVLFVGNDVTDEVVTEIRTFSSQFPWKLVKLGDGPKMVQDYFDINDKVVVQHPAVIAWIDAYDKLLASPGSAATVLALTEDKVEWLDTYGSNAACGMVQLAYKNPVMNEPDVFFCRLGLPSEEPNDAIGLFQQSTIKRLIVSGNVLPEVVSNV